MLTRSALPIGSKVAIEIDMSNKLIKEEEGLRPLVSVNAKVIRRESIGVAVSFYDGYRIRSLPDHLF